MFKRYSEYAGGTCDPLVMSWPARIKVKDRVRIRHQYHHCVDIVPTILEACGLEMPEVYKGVQQYPLSGVSMCYTWDAEPEAPTKKVRQYYAMLGTRGIWENGWKAACLHAPLSGKGKFDKTSGSCTTWTKTAPSPTTWRSHESRAPEETPAPHRCLVRRGGKEYGPAAG